jgi:tetratricopeptide (TPR) repeat protein
MARKMKLAVFIALIPLVLQRPLRAQDSPHLARKGVAAYRAGEYDLARLFFARSLRDAVLKGREEWIVKAAANLTDLELEIGEAAEAETLLDGIPVRNRDLRSLWLWKRSQAAFACRRTDSALALIDSALALCRDPEREPVMRGDRLRYLIRGRGPEAWKGDLESWRKRVGGRKGAAVAAAAAMAEGRFGAADSLWREAAEAFRDEGRPAMIAACLNQSALCLLSLGRRAEASETNARAVAIYGELGLELPGLKARALGLLLVEDEAQLANLRRDMDLVGRRFSGFDLQGILDEYTQSLRGGRGLGSVNGPYR